MASGGNGRSRTRLRYSEIVVDVRLQQGRAA